MPTALLYGCVDRGGAIRSRRLSRRLDDAASDRGRLLDRRLYPLHRPVWANVVSAARTTLAEDGMNGIAFAVAILIAAIVWWIGGVTCHDRGATGRAKMDDPGAGLAMFRRVEERFAWQARGATLLAAASDFSMVVVLRLWPDFSNAGILVAGRHGVCSGRIFTIVLFVVEPLFVHRWLERQAATAPGTNTRATAATALGRADLECRYDIGCRLR